MPLVCPVLYCLGEEREVLSSRLDLCSSSDLFRLKCVARAAQLSRTQSPGVCTSSDK